jgi:ribose 5-phosphate isomerase B
MGAEMNIVIASDHAGLTMKRQVVEFVHFKGHTVRDLGTDDPDSVDYPDFAHELASIIEAGSADLGILVCGTGIGMSMAANRHIGVRAAVCTNVFMATATRKHNDANVLCLGERVIGAGTAEAIVEAFLDTAFEGGRHERRVNKIEC